MDCVCFCDCSIFAIFRPVHLNPTPPVVGRPSSPMNRAMTSALLHIDADSEPAPFAEILRHGRIGAEAG